jgi:CheY-like chemotaxis protein
MSSRMKRVLLVDDHEGSVKLCAAVVVELGHLPVVAATVADALFIHDHQPVDLIVSDIRLEDGTGHELVRRIRERAHVPAIAINGLAY